MITLIRLISAILVPVVLSVIFYFLEKSTKFKNLPYMAKQLLIGAVFGLSAILSTEFGIPVDGAILNVRNASPLSAGLIFGWPSGIIAGLIGGVQRWFSPSGDFTRIACTIATIASGFFAAVVRKYMTDNKRPPWFYGATVGVTSEVLHMLLVFLSNSYDIQRAFFVVQACAIPMIALNAVSVTLSIIIVSILDKQKYNTKKLQDLSQIFQRKLLISVVLAFVVTYAFTSAFQASISDVTTSLTLKTHLKNDRNDIRTLADKSVLDVTGQIKNALPNDITTAALVDLAVVYNATEINIADSSGIITCSTNPDILGYDMASDERSAEFITLLYDENQVVQDYRQDVLHPYISCKYAGLPLAKGGFIQVGFDLEQFHAQINDQIAVVAYNSHIGQSGGVIIIDSNGTIIGDRENNNGAHISAHTNFDRVFANEGDRFYAEIYGITSCCVYASIEGYYIIDFLPLEEASFSRDTSVYMLAFMEIIVFAVLFAQIFFLVKRFVVNNIRKVNKSLEQITSGNLDVKVDVRYNKEFAALSDDINSTVSTLKHYIDEAAARYDKELEIARQIQHSALPSVFPPYPNRKDFAIYATMDPAKEVGGDFYDFYLLDNTHLAFMIADVSGKGIPAAMFMMTAKTFIKSYAESGLSVSEIFTKVNYKLCENNEADMFVTAWIGILDLDTGIVKYANAGHNPPVVKRKDGKYEFLKSRANFVLAGMSGVRYRENQIKLEPGDEIFLYTDGVTEAHNKNNELFGEDALLDSLNKKLYKSPDELCKQVKCDVDTFAGDIDQFDDITMLCVRLNSSPSKTMSDIKPVLESFPEISSFVEDTLEGYLIPAKLIHKFLIVIDEIFSNIVYYSSANFVHIKLTKEQNFVSMSVIDDGKPYNPLENSASRDAPLEAKDKPIGGLGILMVKNIVDDSKYEYTNGQNKLTLVINLPDLNQ
ncbi:MAG: SpoIIE family protein phosphatase [Clostridia bacterium]|nr:SpoIIE family protein phosphatase [Clostridia bacterium]